MYGNNFGLFGSMAKARRLLSVMHRITAPGAAIIASAADPHSTRDPVHIAYHRQNQRRGRMAGQIRLRVRYCQFRGPWFDYLFASPTEVRAIVEGTPWTVDEIVPSPGPGFVAVLRKRQSG